MENSGYSMSVKETFLYTIQELSFESAYNMITNDIKNMKQFIQSSENMDKEALISLLAAVDRMEIMIDKLTIHYL